MSESHSAYFIPEPSRWPIVGTLALFVSFIGGAIMLNGSGFGTFILGLGAGAIIFFFFGWFIFSEVMFFAAFFGALFYARIYSVPWIGGEGAKLPTHEFLWPMFEAIWPLMTTPDATIEGGTTAYNQIKEVIPAWGVPAVNTLILLSSGVTVTLAHWSLKKNNRKGLC